MTATYGVLAVEFRRHLTDRAEAAKRLSLHRKQLLQLWDTAMNRSQCQGEETGTDAFEAPAGFERAVYESEPRRRKRHVYDNNIATREGFRVYDSAVMRKAGDGDGDGGDVEDVTTASMNDYEEAATDACDQTQIDTVAAVIESTDIDDVESHSSESAGAIENRDDSLSRAAMTSPDVIPASEISAPQSIKGEALEDHLVDCDHLMSTAEGDHIQDENIITSVRSERVVIDERWDDIHDVNHHCSPYEDSNGKVDVKMHDMDAENTADTVKMVDNHVYNTES